MHWRYYSGEGLGDLTHTLKAVFLRVEDVSFGHNEVDFVLILQEQMLDHVVSAFAKSLTKWIKKDKYHITMTS